MTLPKIRFRSLLSFFLAISIASAFSLSSLADATGEARSADKLEIAARDALKTPAAILVASGDVSINGYAAQTGSTVMSGSQVSTRRNSIASVDLGPLGRVVLRPETSIQLNLAPGAARIKTQSDRVRVVVLQGELSVVSNRGNYAMASGEDVEFAGAVELTPETGTVFTVQNQGQNSPAQDPSQTGTNNPPPKKKKKYMGVPWWGYLAFAGVAGGIAAGVIVDHDSGNNNNRVVSNPVP